MDYLFVNVQNTTSQTMTLNSVTGLSKDNVFVTNDCLTLEANASAPVGVIGYAYATGSMIYNITEQMTLQIQWTIKDETEAPTSFDVGVNGGTEYSTSWTGPVITSDPNDINWDFYTYTVTVSEASS